MQRFRNIREMAKDAASAAERARETSKEKLQSVGADQLSQRLRETSEKSVNTTTDAARSITVRPKELIDEAAARIADTSEKAVNTTTDAARSTTVRSKELVDEATARFSDIAELLQGLSDEAIDKLFPECTAPMYIIPTGSGPEDYALVFQFDDIVKNLNSGAFVRPKIEAWSSGYQGYDLERFGEELKREFTSQFALAREQRIQSVEELEAASPKISDEMASDLGSSGVAILTSVGLAASLGTAVVVLGPSLPAVILLLFALGFGGKALSLVDDLRKERTRSGRAKRELNRDLQSKIEEHDEVDSKSEVFQRAVRNIEIRTHPKLQELHLLICDIENVPFQSGDAMPTHDAPDIEPYLRHPELLRKLPDPYQNLLTAI